MYTRIRPLILRDQLSIGEVAYLIAFDGVEAYRNLGREKYFQRVLEYSLLDERAEKVIEMVLSPREEEVLRTVVAGKSIAAMAKERRLSSNRLAKTMNDVVMRLQRQDAQYRLEIPNMEMWERLPAPLCRVLIEHGLESYEQLLDVSMVELAALMGAKGFHEAMVRLAQERPYVAKLELTDMLALLTLDRMAYTMARSMLRAAMNEPEGELLLPKAEMLRRLERIEQSFGLIF